MTQFSHAHFETELLETFFNRFAKQMRQKRIAKGLTQKHLVAQLEHMGIHISQGYISLIESGERREPNIKKILALAVVLDISLDAILTDMKGEG